ncbi:MAG: hypothetical protein GY865_01085, partial [candidate division Zixibacteria bacterium]|nr:hypothetical protein [candidate division Zixibacteria bacterium]
MKNKLKLVLLFSLLFSASAFAQWTVTPLGMGTGYSTIDDSGNIYISRMIGSDPQRNFEVKKYDCNGTLLWENIWDSGFDEFLYKSAVDSLGNSYLAGVKTDPNDPNVYGDEIRTTMLIKYSSSGELLWVCQSPTHFYPRSIHITQQGRVWLSGETEHEDPDYCWYRSNYPQLTYYCVISSDGALIFSGKYTELDPSYRKSGAVRFVDTSGYAYFQAEMTHSNCFDEWCGTIGWPDCEWVRDRILTKLDTNGNVLSNYDLGYKSVGHISQSGEYIYCSDLQQPRSTKKFTSDWTLLWSLSPHNKEHFPKINDADGTAIFNVAISTGEHTPAEYWLTCYNSEGTELWDNYLGAGSHLYYGDNSFDSKGNWIGLTLGKQLHYYNTSDGTIEWEIDLSGYSYASNLMLDSLDNIYITIRSSDGLDVIKITPAKKLVIKDSDDELMANTEFELIRISNDIPDLTEDTLGTFTTDNDGEFTFESEDTGEITFEGNTLLIGDTLKVALNVHSQGASKHPGVLGTKYSIHLDNAKFNFDGSIKFMEIDNSAKQEVIMDHTEFRYNLLVSVEWDASLDYLSDLQASFTYMSNYLYDVSDGQIRLDTIAVYDNKEYWDQADIWIRASNIAHPNAHVWGINGNAAIAGRIQMPRRWFGNEDACRNDSYTESPLDLTHSTVYRTICHEFGHYGLGFYDEYLFAFGAQCAEINNYGFMQYQYDGGGINSTEMSNSFRYASANCGNTEQYMNNLLLSCWGYFENMFEKEYGASNLSVPIIKPEERDSLPTWPNDTKCYAGPNDNIYAPDYNVGELIVFPVNPENPSADVNTVEIEIRDILGGAPLSKSIVYTYKQEMGVTIDIVKQGATSDMGKIRALGVNSDDLVVAFGIVDTIGIAKSANSARSIWLCGEATSGKSGNSRLGNKFSSSSFNESMVIELNRVDGNFPMLFDLSLNESTIDYSMITQTSFSEKPTLMVLPDNGSLLNYSFNTSNGGYETTIADDCGKVGMATVWAKDNSSANFFINTDYICYEP